MSDYRENLHMIPSHMHDAILRYIEDGIRPGSFLEAIISNDLKGAFMRADHINSEHIKDFVEYMYWHTPSSCQGSQEAFENWVQRGGLKGLIGA